MNRVTFPLQPGSEGPALDDLQVALLLFLNRGMLLANDAVRRQEWPPILLQEQAQHTYGEMTSALVSVFQSERNLQNTGNVDVITANSMNAVLNELGVLDGHNVETRIVDGMLRFPDGSPSRQTHIYAFDPEFLDGAMLGHAQTNTDGNFEIRYDPGLYTRLGPGVDHTKDFLELVVAAYDDANQMIASSDPNPDPPAQLTVDLEVDRLLFNPQPAEPPEPPVQAADWHVRGRVVDAAGSGLTDYQVKLLEYDLDSTPPIDSKQTGPDGMFDFGVVLDDALRSGDDGTGLDLIFQVSSPAGVDQPVQSIVLVGKGPQMFVPRLAESEDAPLVLMNISADLEVRVAVGSEQPMLTGASKT